MSRKNRASAKLQLTAVGPTSWMENGSIMSTAADRFYPIPLKTFSVSYIGRNDRFVKSKSKKKGRSPRIFSWEPMGP